MASSVSSVFCFIAFSRLFATRAPAMASCEYRKCLSHLFQLEGSSGKTRQACMTLTLDIPE